MQKYCSQGPEPALVPPPLHHCGSYKAGKSPPVRIPQHSLLLRHPLRGRAGEEGGVWAECPLGAIGNCPQDRSSQGCLLGDTQSCLGVFCTLHSKKPREETMWGPKSPPAPSPRPSTCMLNQTIKLSPLIAAIVGWERRLLENVKPCTNDHPPPTQCTWPLEPKPSPPWVVSGFCAFLWL